MRSIADVRKRGRPPVNATPLTVRVPPDLLADLDQFIAAEPEPKPTRPDAIRRLLGEALATLGFRGAQ